MSEVWVWNIQAVHGKSDLARPREGQTNCNPFENECQARWMSAIWRRTNLVFTLPMLGVLDIASAAYIDVLSGFDKHIIGRDDIGDRRLARIVSCDPKGDGDVIRGISESNREKTMEAEQELGAAVVECFGEF